MNSWSESGIYKRGQMTVPGIRKLVADFIMTLGAQLAESESVTPPFVLRTSEHQDTYPWEGDRSVFWKIGPYEMASGIYVLPITETDGYGNSTEGKRGLIILYETLVTDELGWTSIAFMCPEGDWELYDKRMWQIRNALDELDAFNYPSFYPAAEDASIETSLDTLSDWGFPDQEQDPGGRPPDPNYDWAYQEIVGKGRGFDEVYDEWRTKRSSPQQRMYLSNKRDAFDAAIKRRKKKQESRTKGTKGTKLG